MKIKTGLFGVLLSIAAAAAYGLGVQSAPAEPSASAPAANPAINLTPAEITERVRTFVARGGVDPDSENGRILVAWLVRVAQDPGYYAGLRSQLPPDGSRPLPYSRLVVNGARVSRKAAPNRSIDDEDGTTDVVIKNITIVQS